MPSRPELKFHWPIFSVPQCLRGEFSSCFGPRMVFLIHALQPVKCHMRINLSSRDIGMSENRLHSAQVRAILDHVSRATVPQHMRTSVASVFCRCSYHLPHSLPRDLLCATC